MLLHRRAEGGKSDVSCVDGEGSRTCTPDIMSLLKFSGWQRRLREDGTDTRVPGELAGKAVANQIGR